MIEITANGFIEVTRNGVVLSRHRAEREALQSCAKQGPGAYVLYYPTVRVDIIGEDVTLETGEISGVLHV
jgi:hypothetical protein